MLFGYKNMILLAENGTFKAKNGRVAIKKNYYFFARGCIFNWVIRSRFKN